MSYISTALRKLVIRRAGNRCEYCRLSQKGQEATFHLDHIYPFVLGGETIAENLALACVSCSLRKNAKEKVIDPKTNQETPLFHPRKDVWKSHFIWKGVKIEGLTATGRATVKALNLNRPLILAIREEEILFGRQED